MLLNTNEVTEEGAEHEKHFNKQKYVEAKQHRKQLYAKIPHRQTIYKGTKHPLARTITNKRSREKKKRQNPETICQPCCIQLQHHFTMILSDSIRHSTSTIPHTFHPDIHCDR